MDFDEENAFRAKLSQFTGSTEFYWHSSQTLRYTEGVKYLAERARLHWFIDLIASWQSRVLRDPWLAEFQLWELHVKDNRASAVCLRDSEDEAFRQNLGYTDSAVHYVRFYLQDHVLMLPSEH